MKMSAIVVIFFIILCFIYFFTYVCGLIYFIIVCSLATFINIVIVISEFPLLVASIFTTIFMLFLIFVINLFFINL